VADTARINNERPYAWGRFTALGLIVAIFTCALDQASKLWLVDVFDLSNRGHVAVAPTLDFVLTWNTGISYGLFPQQGLVGQWALLAFKLVAIVVLWIWLARASSRLAAASLGLIIGGAFGNAIDRLHWPGVMDFVLFHVAAAGWRFDWYVFNLADAAIVTGVVGLLCESLTGGAGAAKAP
jgi:signal peptidase II